MFKRHLFPGLYVAVFVSVSLAAMGARQGSGNGVAIDGDDIGGVVTSDKGPEPGVWVIAETKDLPTGFSRSVVTDDRGRYVVPDLPKATYQVFVRGYGLVDSPKVAGTPGKPLNLKAAIAPNPRAAAEVYPANYWMTLMNIPAKSEFPIPEQGVSAAGRSQGEFIKQLKTDGCMSCHQLGNKATREIPASLGKFDSSTAAWVRRIASGHDGAGMDNQLNGFGRQRALKMFADWSDRIAAGEYPTEAPPRPQGAERNVVISQWDWGDPREYFHDIIASDKRNPLVNANGPVYGVHENSSDHMTYLEPAKNSWTQVTVPFKPGSAMNPNSPAMANPSPYWGEEIIWNTAINGHSNEMDHKARAWNTSRVRTAQEVPDYCRDPTHPSAKLWPVPAGRGGGRQYTIWDHSAKKFEIVDTCFSTFHLNFDTDPDNKIWSGGAGLVGYVDVNKWDATKDVAKSQGWTALIVDTNGNGQRDAYVEPNEPVDPAKDKRIQVSFYGVMPSPVDNSVWGSQLGFPGAVVRMDPGSNFPDTALAEIYMVPFDEPRAPVQGFSPRGMDVDKEGVAWTVLASGHLAGFDRRKCKGPLNGPTAAEGKLCPEGWTLHKVPGPNFKGDVISAATDSNYYNWSDKFNSLGLGENVQIATGNISGALLVLVNGKWIVMRVPYPLGFYAKSINGRIDDPNAGWKGRGLWTGWGNRNPWHNEGGKGKQAMAIKFQMRPDPLAH